MIRVALADDQELVRAGFRAILETQDDLEVVGEAGDGAAAVEVARSKAPDVVVMDIRMPVMDGLAATRRIGRAIPVDARAGFDDLRPRRVRLRGDDGRGERIPAAATRCSRRP